MGWSQRFLFLMAIWMVVVALVAAVGRLRLEHTAGGTDLLTPFGAMAVPMPWLALAAILLLPPALGATVWRDAGVSADPEFGTRSRI